MSDPSKSEPVPEETWRASANPHQLVRWSRRVGNARKYLLLGCAIVRHGPTGPQTDIGRRILDVIEEFARQPLQKPAVRLVEDVLSPRFPGTFQTGPPYFTSAARRALGSAEHWLWCFVWHARVPRYTTKALPNVLIDATLGRARAEATREAAAEVEAIRRELIAELPPARASLLRRLVGLRAAEPTPPLVQFRDAILERLPEPQRARARAAVEPSAFTAAWAAGMLELQRRQERVAAAKAVLSDLVHEVLGDPFRPWRVNPDWLAANHGAARQITEHLDRTGDFADLPILADALEDSGCTDSAALEHCRSGGNHVRGCWVLDAVLGR